MNILLVIAILDVTRTTVVYAGKTVVNTVDMITPDIVNNVKDENERAPISNSICVMKFEIGARSLKSNN